MSCPGAANEMSPSSSPVPLSKPVTTSEYSPEERALLLCLAHEAIAAKLEGREPDTSPPTEHLAELRGVFTTLHLHGKLRGCIGYVLPRQSLYEAVAETAQAAALQDPRFEPVSGSEAANLQIEISVLSPLTPISPDEVIVGMHGLLVTLGYRRGLLLPQVPVEWGWDRETFLDETCLKAGLPAHAWKHGATIEAFTAEIFGDPANPEQTAHS